MRSIQRSRNIQPAAAVIQGVQPQAWQQHRSAGLLFNGLQRRDGAESLSRRVRRGVLVVLFRSQSPRRNPSSGSRAAAPISPRRLLICCECLPARLPVERARPFIGASLPYSNLARRIVFCARGFDPLLPVRDTRVDALWRMRCRKPRALPACCVGQRFRAGAARGRRTRKTANRLAGRRRYRDRQQSQSHGESGSSSLHFLLFGGAERQSNFHPIGFVETG